MRRCWHSFFLFCISSCLVLSFSGCGKKGAATEGDARTETASRDGSAGKSAAASRPVGRPQGGRPGGGPGGFGGFGGEPRAAVPVEVTSVVRREISSYLETNGTLEAENDVDMVARTNGPVVELLVEEGMRVRAGQLLARIDPDEARARLEISRVNRDEAKIAYERAQRLFDDELLSQEAYDQARSTYQSSEAQLLGEQIVFGYTEIKAPFSGVVSSRYIKLAQNVSNNEKLFRVTSFDPLLCPIQVPERELPRLEIGQRAYITVEAWPDERFPARVLRISPVVDAATGTVKVTLEVSAEGKLRPGMFTSVFLETETRSDTLVIPKSALSLESIGDTVYVASAETASRREVSLGFQEGEFIEVLSGVEEGETVIVIGQDGLSDGTPIQILGGRKFPSAQPPALAPDREEGTRMAGGAPPESSTGPPASARPRAAGGPGEGRPGRVGAGRSGGGPPGGSPPRGFDPSNLTPERLEFIKARMKERGMTDDEIEERLKKMRERAGGR